MSTLNRSLSVVCLFSILALLFLGVISAQYTRSTPEIGASLLSHDRSSFNAFESCQGGTDFFLQVAPFGCSPAVVRSDLLAEQDVPVFCALGATQVNPFLKVDAIQSVSFSGRYPEGIRGVGFHPARGALGYRNNENNPILNNVGYAVIVLEQQPLESELPDFIEGNFSARLRYNILDAYGLGEAQFFVQETTEEEWANSFNEYSFWNGQGYVRAEEVTSEGVRLSVYDGTYINNEGHSYRNKVSSFSLSPGQVSSPFFLPGMECTSGYQIRVDGLVDPERRAQFRVGADQISVGLGDRFLDNRCRVTHMTKSGAFEEVTVVCSEDDSQRNEFTFTKNPHFILQPEGTVEPVIVSLGQFVTTTSDGSSLYIAGYQQDARTSPNGELIFLKASSQGASLSSDDLSRLSSLLAEQRFEGTLDVSNLFGPESRLQAVTLSRKSFTVFDVSFTALSEAYLDSESGDEASSYVQFREAYDLALEDFSSVEGSFRDETYSNFSTLGEEALRSRVLLSKRTSQYDELDAACDLFYERYSSQLDTDVIQACLSREGFSLDDESQMGVFVKGQLQTISFVGVKDPSPYDYSATIAVSGGEEALRPQIVSLEEQVFLDAERIDSVQLTRLTETEAIFSVAVRQDESSRSPRVQTITIPLRGRQAVGPYTLEVTDIRYTQQAQITVAPVINPASGSEVTVPFKIGIEKRAIELNPDKTQKKIDQLEETISEWEEKSEKLGNVVKGMKAACLVTGAALTAKNFVGNLDGQALARTQVMRGEGGWYDQCGDLVSEGSYETLDQCLVEEGSAIEADVDRVAHLMKGQSDYFDGVESRDGYATQNVFGERSVDTDKVAAEYIPRVSQQLQSVGTFSDPSGQGEDIAFSSIQNTLAVDKGWEKGYYSLDDLRSMELYSQMIADPQVSEDTRNMARAELYSLTHGLQEYATSDQQQSSFAQDLRTSFSTDVPVRSYGATDSIVGVYDGATYTAEQKKGSVERGNAIQGVVYNHQKYLLVLEQGEDNKYHIRNTDGVLDQNGAPVDSAQATTVKRHFSYFQKYDRTTYQNAMQNPQVKYYETDPYKGLPALVPFNVKQGWYAATKQTLPIGGNIRAYDDSGRVSSFWLCNVGANGRANFFDGIQDDICQQVNLGTGQPYNQFPGLSETEAQTLVQQAVRAIQDASQQYRNGVSRVRILGSTLEVGNPALNVPSMQCQDFMSPSDCQLLFNVCDPVICPSSRCDFGGQYPVQDVVQSGIIGSVALCLPNFKEGIYIPVCLTGIQAGIDGYTSILGSYQQCLQESLDTGQMTGICDEIYSVYMCEFFWRQGIPLARIALPNIISAFLDQNVRGGGEYLGVTSAWSTAEKSLGYFTEYYAANSFRAFRIRSAEDVGSEVCKSYVSATYPTNADLLDQFTEPDSPPQFHGRFDEIPYTTATTPPTSQYKVFYHIYAGKDSRAYFQVYLQGSSGSSFYQDTNLRRIVDSGYIPKGGTEDQTIDFTAPSGYTELCISVNGQVECGFQQVSTSFAVNYVTDHYVASQAEETDIRSEAACVSGSITPYALLLNPNVQSGAEEVINPAIYERGITRICSTGNPGQGTDTFDGQSENPRWVKVGYCDDPQIGCWLDQSSVQDAIKTEGIRNATLEKTTSQFLEILQAEGEYMDEDELARTLNTLGDVRDLRHVAVGLNNKDGVSTELQNLREKRSMIDKELPRVFWAEDKGKLVLLRGELSSQIAQLLWRDVESELKTIAPPKDDAKSDGSSGRSGGDTGADASSLQGDSSSGVTSTGADDLDYSGFIIKIEDGEYKERYEDHQPEFEEHSQEIPPGWSKEQFRALLVAIATRESSLGVDSEGNPQEDLFMGYDDPEGQGGQDRCPGADAQIRCAAQMLVRVLSAPEDSTNYQSCGTGPILPTDSVRIKCVLGIYGPAEDPEYKEEAHDIYVQWRIYFGDPSTLLETTTGPSLVKTLSPSLVIQVKENKWLVSDLYYTFDEDDSRWRWATSENSREWALVSEPEAFDGFFRSISDKNILILQVLSSDIDSLGGGFLALSRGAHEQYRTDSTLVFHSSLDRVDEITFSPSTQVFKVDFVGSSAVYYLFENGRWVWRHPLITSSSQSLQRGLDNENVVSEHKDFMRPLLESETEEFSGVAVILDYLSS